MRPPRHILMVLVKNTAALDYALPLLCRIRREHPGVRLSLLHTRLSRRELLRDAKCYDRFLGEAGVKQYDLLDFAPRPLRAMRNLLRRLLGTSPRDVPRGRVGLLGRLGRKFRAAMHRWVARRICRDEILPRLAPDVVLLDHTSSQTTGEAKFVFDYLLARRPRTILLPHAPHHADEQAFMAFPVGDEPLPDFCEHWVPMPAAKPWAQLPQKRERFRVVGYPGLDGDWLAKLDRRPKRRSATEPLRCLFIIRRFLEPGEAGEGKNAFVYTHEEMRGLLARLVEAVRSAGREVEIIVKPHPSNNFPAVEALLASGGLERWRVTSEPVYAWAGKIDLAVSLYSTILLIPAMMGKPVVLLESSTQRHVHEWEVLRQLYEGLRFYVPESEDLRARFIEAVEQAVRQREGASRLEEQIEHLRRFFPDGAGEVAMREIFSVGTD